MIVWKLYWPETNLLMSHWDWSFSLWSQSIGFHRRRYSSFVAAIWFCNSTWNIKIIDNIFYRLTEVEIYRTHQKFAKYGIFGGTRVACHLLGCVPLTTCQVSPFYMAQKPFEKMYILYTFFFQKPKFWHVLESSEANAKLSINENQHNPLKARSEKPLNSTIAFGKPF